MALEEQVFARKSFKFENLEPAGFTKTAAGYSYQAEFLDGAFVAKLSVSKTGAVSGQVIEVDTGSEYLPLRLQTQQGAFVRKVRAGYVQLLEKIAAQCCQEELFVQAQTNRLAVYLKEHYGETPDYPFSKPQGKGFASFRVRDNQKWYALVMNVPRSKVETDCAAAEASEQLEIVNLKAEAESMPALLKRPGIYPGYHMNHKYWISVLLDDSLSDADLYALVEKSRSLVVRSRGAPERTQRPQSWLIPANASFFDVIEYFSSKDEVEWKQSAALKPDDYAYIYVTKPIGEVLFKCQVLESNLPYEYTGEHVSMRRVVRLRVLLRLPKGSCTLETLARLGAKCVRSQRRLSPELEEYLTHLEERL
ncbi:MAG: MmcQ/YjbR family DNA-binding protein [Succinivibrio sp.]|nr:MmcQ/YjbR family DNA-binding protein [Succinivibrio sp.]